MSASVEEFIEVLNAEQYIDLRKLQDYARHGCKPSVRGETWLYLLGVLSSDKSQEMTSVRSQYLYYEHMDKSVVPSLEKAIRAESTRYYKRKLVARSAPGRTLARSALRIREGGRKSRGARGNGAYDNASDSKASGWQEQGPNRVDSDQARPLAGIMGRNPEEDSLERSSEAANAREGAEATATSAGGLDEDPEVASANEMKRFNGAVRNIVCAYLNKGKRRVAGEEEDEEDGEEEEKRRRGKRVGSQAKGSRRERSVVGFVDDLSSEGEGYAPHSSAPRQRRATSSGSSAGSITAASVAAASARLRGLGLADEGDGNEAKAMELDASGRAIAPDWAYPQRDLPLLGGTGVGDDGDEDVNGGVRLSSEEELEAQGVLSPHRPSSRGRGGAGGGGRLDEVHSGASLSVPSRMDGQQGLGKSGSSEAANSAGPISEMVLEPDLIALAAPFVKCIRVEAGMYFAFDRLMGMIELHYSRRPLPESVSDFLTLFRTTLPELYAYFEEEEVDVVGFASAWLRHLLAAEMRIEDVLLLWDSYFSMPDPLDLHMYVCIAVLANCKDALEELDQSEANSMLFSLPPLDVDRIINEATNIKLSHRQSQMEG